MGYMMAWSTNKIVEIDEQEICSDTQKIDNLHLTEAEKAELATEE